MRELADEDEAALDEWFSAEQNARLVKNAEEYYRSMFRGRVSSWNLRDQHMVETLVLIAEHLESQGRAGRLIVWAHNSHLGDARATRMGRGGEWNVGQLVRQQWGRERCALVGFTTHTGSVSAADDWDEPVQRKSVRPSLPGSWERLFHEVAESSGSDRFWLHTRDDARLRALLSETRLERAIGVIYRPGTERMSHYFEAEIGEQFDAVIHLDETRALTPLERNPVWEKGELPETYPSGI
jgi:erythromycin esterase-like protein